MVEIFNVVILVPLVVMVWVVAVLVCRLAWRDFFGD